VTSEPWPLGTCRRQDLPELLPAHVPMMSPAPPVIPRSPLPTQLQKQRERLLESFSEAEIEKIESQHQGLASVYQEEQTLKDFLDNFTDCSTVDDVWHLLEETFMLLHDSAVDLATVFPSTTAVESDFSPSQWENNEFRSALTGFLLTA
jgi:hypothetical protein